MKAERRMINRVRRETGVELSVASRACDNYSDFNEACEYAKKQQEENNNKKILKTEKDKKIFLDAITNPKTPNDFLIEAVKKYNELMNI